MIVIKIAPLCLLCMILVHIAEPTAYKFLSRKPSITSRRKACNNSKHSTHRQNRPKTEALNTKMLDVRSFEEILEEVTHQVGNQNYEAGLITLLSAMANFGIKLSDLFGNRSLGPLEFKTILEELDNFGLQSNELLETFAVFVNQIPYVLKKKELYDREGMVQHLLKKFHDYTKNPNLYEAKQRFLSYCDRYDIEYHLEWFHHEITSIREESLYFQAISKLNLNHFLRVSLEISITIPIATFLNLACKDARYKLDITKKRDMEDLNSTIADSLQKIQDTIQGINHGILFIKNNFWPEVKKGVDVVARHNPADEHDVFAKKLSAYLKTEFSLSNVFVLSKNSSWQNEGHYSISNSTRSISVIVNRRFIRVALQQDSLETGGYRSCIAALRRRERPSEQLHGLCKLLVNELLNCLVLSSQSEFIYSVIGCFTWPYFGVSCDEPYCQYNAVGLRVAKMFSDNHNNTKLIQFNLANGEKDAKEFKFAITWAR